MSKNSDSPHNPSYLHFCWTLFHFSGPLRCARFAENLTKIFWVSYFVEFVLCRFSHFNIAIAYSNSKFCCAWTQSFLWVHLQFRQNEHTPDTPGLDFSWRLLFHCFKPRVDIHTFWGGVSDTHSTSFYSEYEWKQYLLHIVRRMLVVVFIRFIRALALSKECSIYISQQCGLTGTLAYAHAQ